MENMSYSFKLHEANDLNNQAKGTKANPPKGGDAKPRAWDGGMSRRYGSRAALRCLVYFCYIYSW